jgi:hypothetical protein
LSAAGIVPAVATGLALKRPELLGWFAIAIPIAAYFGPALFSNGSFAFRDAGHFYYPLFQWCCREWAAGRVPLWNPAENCGVPVLADVTSSVFYPGKLIFLLPLSFAFLFKLYTVVHVVLAAGGSYWLARTWKASQTAAALAAIAYSCGGNVVFQYTNVVFLVGAAWLPFAALAAERMLRERSWLAAGWLAAVLALMILGGDPQAAYHALVITALYAVVLGTSAKGEPLTDAAPRPRRMSGLVTRVGLCCIAASGAYLLAAVQILPSSEALKLSDRAIYNRPRNVYEAATVGFRVSDQQSLGEPRQQSIARGLFGEPEEHTHLELAYDFSVGPWRLVEYLWPNIGGRMFPTHRRWFSLLPAEGRIWTPTLYMGLVPVLLAVSVIRLRSAPTHIVWLSWIVLLFTVGSFGTYGLGWLLRELWPALGNRNPDQLTIGSPVGGVYWLMLTLLPDYVYFRYPAKLLPLISLAISQLAAIGFDRAATQSASRLQRAIFIVGCGSAVIGVLVWCAGPKSCSHLAQQFFAACIGTAPFANIGWSDPSFGPFDATGAYYDVLFALIQTAIVALIAWWSFRKISSGWTSAKLLLVFLTGIEIAVANSWLVVTAPVDVWTKKPVLAESIRSHQTQVESDVGLSPRVFRANLASWRPANFAATSSGQRLAKIARWEHDTLFPKHPLLNQLSLVESYGSVKSADYESLLTVAKQHGPRQQDNTLLPQPSVLRLLGTDFLVLPQSHRLDFAERITDARLETAPGMPEGAALWQMTRTLPRMWIVHDVETVAELPQQRTKRATDERTYNTLFPGDRPRDFLRSATVETNEQLIGSDETSATDRGLPTSNPAESCRITHYSPQRVVAEAQLDQPGLLILGDSWYPGWKAVVTSADGQREVPIYRTDRVLRGVWLPAGKHRIEYRFRSPTFRLGAIISALSWAILTAALMTGLLLHRRRSRSTNSVARLEALERLCS